MDLIFILLTQLKNQTPFNLDFEFDHGRRLLPELGPGKTRFAKTSRALRRPGKIRVLIDGEFTGIELDSQVILDYVRVVFRVDGDGDVLCVVGARENRGNDFLLRHRYFGCMRNFYWNYRPLQPIDRSDSKMSTKLRNIEGHCRYLASFVDIITLQKRYPSPEKEGPKKDTRVPPTVYEIVKKPPVQQERPRVDPRPLDHSVDFEKQVRSMDPQPLEPTVEIGENGISLKANGTVTPQQLRPRVPRPLRSPMETGENGIKSLRPSGTSTFHQARARDEPWPSDRPRPRDEPRPLEPPTGEIGIKSLQPNGMGTAQQAWPRDDESLTNVHDKDSFVHGLIIVLSLIFCVLLKCLF